ncbi:unnamed protein product [Microthlaspi erraticum]|uniref:Uncharacterized protein n=1 Tax=Microthlaspi erraticum TaxID=1685480 RepID=A0A6D2KS63_9BRAS|nr:unnamed protein product [Microthlaspi erraticum]
MGLAQPMPKELSLGDKGASSTNSSIKLKTKATRSSSTTRPRDSTLRINKFKMLRGERSKAAFTKEEITREARRMLNTLTKEDEEEIERLREERRTKRRNDPISSESELGEFEIGMNHGRGERGESSNEEGEEVNQEIEGNNNENAITFLAGGLRLRSTFDQKTNRTSSSTLIHETATLINELNHHFQLTPSF